VHRLSGHHGCVRTCTSAQDTGVRDEFAEFLNKLLGTLEEGRVAAVELDQPGVPHLLYHGLDIGEPIDLIVDRPGKHPELERARRNADVIPEILAN
jgi:hypothetical protein